MSTDTRLWHHIMLTTYGAWLYGDRRGFRTRHHREHVEGDYKNPPPAGKYAAQERRSRELLTQPPVVIPAKTRRIIGRALWQEFSHLGAWVLIVAVGGQHVHLLVKLPAKRARHWTGRAKRFTTLKLRDRGWQGELWGVRCKAKRIRDRAHQVNTYHYIERHAEQGSLDRRLEAAALMRPPPQAQGRPPTSSPLSKISGGLPWALSARRRRAPQSVQSSALLPSPHILTIFGSNRATISTRSCCSRITSSMFL